MAQNNRSPVTAAGRYLAYSIGLVAITGLLQAIFYRHIVNADEGVVLAGAWDLWQGRRLYLDFFEYIPPGTFYLIYWVWRICGVSYLAAKFISVFALVVGALGLYRIGRLMAGKITAGLAPFFFLIITINWPIISYYTFNLTGLIWSCYFILRFWQNRRWTDCLISGALGGLSALFIWHRSLMLLAAVAGFMLGFYLREKKSFWGKMLLLYLLLFSLPLFVVLWQWPPSILWYDLAVYPFVNYPDIVEFNFTYTIIFALNTALLAGAAYHDRRTIIIFSLALQILLLLASASNPDLFHTISAIFPILYLLPWFMEKIQVQILLWRICLTIYTALWLLLLALLPAALYLSFSRNFLHSNIAPVLAYVGDHCITSPYIYAGPFMPNIYFETGKKNALPYAWLITRQNTPEQFREAARILAHVRPECAILSYTIVEKYNYDRNNPVDNFIDHNYHLGKKFGNISVMLINSP